ncbi:hypothetical protein ACTWP5_03030 [Streptomyces sp. 4N509B]|uniref:hypothetical protein n=1 Tax=Streptomyces sp. 4N509B TaxID=3457413 RepID=UPI003FD23EB9
MPRLGRLVRRLLPTRSTRPAAPERPERPVRPGRPSRPLLPRPRGEYANDGFPVEHPRAIKRSERDG